MATSGLGADESDVFQRRLHRHGGRLHQRAVEGRRHGQQQRALRPGELRELHGALDRRGRAGDHHLAARRCRWPPGRSRRSGRGRSPPASRSSRPAEIEAEDGRHRAFADRNGLLHRLAARRSRRAASSSVSDPAAQRAEYSPSECPATKPLASWHIEAGFGLQNPLAAMLAAMRAGWALAVSVSSASGPSNIIGRGSGRAPRRRA